MDPAKEPRVCLQCDGVKVTPPSEQWSPVLRRFLVHRLLTRIHEPIRQPQAFWERLLVGAYQGTPGVRWAVTPDELYLRAVQDATAWDGNGGTLDL